MAKKRKRDYDFRIRKTEVGSGLYEDRKIPFCIRCKAQLIPDWKTSSNIHLCTVPDVPPPSYCKVLFPKRGPKFKYKSENEVREEIKFRDRARKQKLRKKAKDRKDQKKEALDRLNERKRAERAALQQLKK